MKKQCRAAIAAAALSPVHLDSPRLDDQETLKRRRDSGIIKNFSVPEPALLTPPRKRFKQDVTLPNDAQTEVLSEPLEHDWAFGTALTSPYASSNANIKPLGMLSDSVLKTKTNAFSVLPNVHRQAELLSQTNRFTTSPLSSTQPVDLDAFGSQWPLGPITWKSVEIDDPGLFGLPMSTVETECVGSKCLTQSDKPTASQTPTDSYISPSIEPAAISMLDISTEVLPTTSQPSSFCVTPPPTARPALRTIDRNRPVETFSAQEVADIEHAAECLSIFRCDREAFELFATILRRHLSNAWRDSTFWYLIIQCAQTASIPEHVEVIQNIIRTELSQLQQPQFTDPCFESAAATNLLLHMLLALTSSRTADLEDTILNIDKARAYIDQKGLVSILQQLPIYDRSLDLAVYRNLLRLQTPRSSDLTCPIPFGFTSSGAKLPRDHNMPFESWILFRQPGPFELQSDGRMGNACIRSCISWCQEILSTLHSIPITAGIFEVCPNEAGVARAEANALFIILWEHWVTCKSSTRAAEWTWITETQSKMGISEVELLLLVCRTIYNCYCPGNTPAGSDLELLRQLRIKAENLSRQSDFEVARGILREYVSRNTNTIWPSWKPAVQRLEMARMMTSFENTLMVRFPRLGITRDLTNSELIPPGVEEISGENSLPREEAKEEEESLVISISKAQYLSPTLASSLSSIDLSSFKKTSNAAMVRFSKLVRKSFRAPASVRRRGRESHTSNHNARGSDTSDISIPFQAMSIFGDGAI